MSTIAYTGAVLTVCEAARSLPNPPTGAGADVSDWTRTSDGVAIEYVELTILAGANVSVASGAMLVAEEVHDTYPEESNAVTLTNATEIVNYTAHGFYTGDGPIRLTGTLPAELSLTTEYYAIRVASGTFKLATSHALALAGTAVGFSSDGADVIVHWVTGIKSTSTESNGVSITALEEWFTFAAPHSIATGTRVQVANSGGSLPTGLVADTDYYAIADATTTIAFATTAENAAAGTRINLTAAGTGTNSVISDNRGPTSATAYVMFAELNEGYAFDLTPSIGYRELIQHRPEVVAYHLVATLDAFVPITATVRGLRGIAD